MATKIKCTLICHMKKYMHASKTIKGLVVIKFDSNYIGNQHWYPFGKGSARIEGCNFKCERDRE